MHDLMPQYYGETAVWPRRLDLGLRVAAAMLVCAFASPDLLPLLTSTVMPAPAAKLFPHQLMYKWLAYGNGKLSHVTAGRLRGSWRET